MPQAEAAAYQAALQRVATEAGMELAPSGAPRFDMLLLGVGADGHVGSLYPAGAAATDASGAWVLPVVKAKPPASITLSLGVMNAARSVVVSFWGWEMKRMQ
jgi:6-phosphogluconolactonase